MGQDVRLKRRENYILAFAVTAVNIAVMGICFDFYYDLNDDTMMLDIMSGVYSGSPDGHNMQTLYPLGALIALCYRICGSIPWYGLFLCLCQFGCFYLVCVRQCALAERVGLSVGGGKRGPAGLLHKALWLFFSSLFLWGVCLSHLVNIQYTVTSAVLSATAIFLFLTAPDTDNPRRFVTENIPSVLLAILACQLRSEMLLLTFPFICLAGLFRLTEEKKIWTKENLFRYGGVLGVILAGMLLSFGADRIAYGGEAWKEFVRFFEARTTVYDFYPELITEDRYSEALTGLGVAPYQQTLLRNYNYGLDESVNTPFLVTLADYATDTMRAARDWGAIFRKQVSRYYYRTFRGGDGAYAAVLLWLYVWAAVAGLCAVFGPGRRPEGKAKAVFGVLWQLLLLAAARSAVWMFILLRGRDPARITDSLYLVESALLAAMAARRFVRDGKKETALSVRMMAVLFGLIVGRGMFDGAVTLRAEQEQRARVNENWYAIDEYCRAREENFYFEDVYSTVMFSRRIFGEAQTGYANYDILGGWMCKSPLYYEKIGRYGIVSAKEALLEQDNVYLILSDQEAAERGFSWMEDCYGAQGIAVSAEKTDTVGDGYSVYRIRENP